MDENHLAQRRGGESNAFEDKHFILPFMRYEVRCGECGAYFFMPDGESCPNCGADDLKELSCAVIRLHMSASYGDMDIFID